MTTIAPLRRCLVGMTRLVEQPALPEPMLLSSGQALLATLIASDDWLREFCGAPDPQRSRQYFLYCDPLERFSVVSFVWGPGQATPLHASISIHVYGGNIGSVCRHVYDEATGQRREFIPGYANDRLPTPWAGAPHYSKNLTVGDQMSGSDH